MIKNTNFICFGDDWGRHPSTHQHLAKVLLENKDNRILWINSIGMRTPTVNMKDIRRISEKIKNKIYANKNKTEQKSNLYVYNPLVIPFHQSRIARRINKFILSKKIGSTVKDKNMEHHILWTSILTSVDLVGNLEERLSIYLCLDDYAQLPNTSGKLISELEKKMVTKVDIVIVTAKKLLDKFEGKCKALYYIPQGVDVDFFKKASSNKIKTAKEISIIRKPIIGFCGLISEWLDFGLLETIARKHSNWSFVFIGKVEANIDRLSGYKNIIFLGAKPYEELPNYLKAFDVCIIPFLCNELTKYVNPLKLREYLATGKPLVTTNFNPDDFAPFKDLIDICNDNEEFIEAIAKNIKNNDYRLANERQRSILSDSWEARVEEFSNIIEQKF